jgi:hypothetical protein
MASPKRGERPKGSQLRASLKPNKDRLTDRDKELLKYKMTVPQAFGSAATAADMVGSTDPYLSKNEFKPGFYEQNAGKITPEGLYGTASGKKMFEADIVDPDTSMMQNMAEGGSVRGQKNIQVKKKPFKGIF